MLSEETAFLEALRAEPLDDVARLVYADWLDEHGVRASRYLRLVCEMVRLPQEDLLGSAPHDEMMALTPVIDPDWRQAVGRRFEVALIEFAPRDRTTLMRVLMEVIGLPDGVEAEAVVTAAPTALRTGLTYADAVFLYEEWLRYRYWFLVRPRVVVRAIPVPEGGPRGLFDVVLRKLPPNFWPAWPQYKHSVAGVLNLDTRSAADRVRGLPAVLFRSLPWGEVEPTLARVRRAFNRVGVEFLPPDALAVVPHTTEGRA